MGGEKRAWYTLFMHAQFPRIFGNSGYYAVHYNRPSSYLLFVVLQSKMAVTLQGFDEVVSKSA